MMNETSTSGFDESEWSKLFPKPYSALDNLKSNIKLLKKLVAVAISNIVYLRANLPDEAFVQRSLGNLELRMLQKVKSLGPQHPANVIIEMVRDGMSALDKGYLKKLSIVILDGHFASSHDVDLRDAFETYGFYFGSQDKDFSLTRSSKNQGDVPLKETESMPSELTEEYVMKTVKKLLRRLISGTQELDVLPDDASLTVCLEYYDDITPSDYQPKGYQHSDHIPQMQYQDENEKPSLLGMGQVDMMHQKMALRLRSKANVLTPEDDLHPSQIQSAQEQENRQVENDTNEVSEDHSIELETAQMTKKEMKKYKMHNKRKQLEDELENMPKKFSANRM